MNDSLELSVVVPAFNERQNLEPLLRELRAALDGARRRYEIVIVDDGSTDGSDAFLREVARSESRLLPVLLARRVGQSAALAAGFARARGAVIVTLDADLQNDPADLPRVLAALEGADVVSGIRAGRRDSGVRLLSSRIANATRRIVIGDSITDIGCSFKAYRREVLVGLPLFQGVHRFLPALCQFRGARVVEIPVTHRARQHGQSKYGVHNRLWRGLADLIGVRWLKSRLVHFEERAD